jgi:hypothetical protein
MRRAGPGLCGICTARRCGAFGTACSSAADGDEPPSTARLTARLSEQLYENTLCEKYATLFYSLPGCPSTI